MEILLKLKTDFQRVSSGKLSEVIVNTSLCTKPFCFLSQAATSPLVYLPGMVKALHYIVLLLNVKQGSSPTVNTIFIIFGLADRELNSSLPFQ